MSFAINIYGQNLVKDLYSGVTQSSNPVLLTPIGDKIIFCAGNNIYTRLYLSDGTKNGTAIVHPLFNSFNTFEKSLSIKRILQFRGKTYLDTESFYIETDGTYAGTKSVEVIVDECAESTYSNFVVLNDTLFYKCGLNYYKYNGVNYTINDEGLSGFNTGALAEWNNRLIFQNGSDLYITDTTDSGYRKISVDEVTYGGEILGVDSLIFFSGYSNTAGTELWCYSAKGDSTYMVADLKPGLSGSYPERFIEINGKLIFQSGLTTYLTDGTKEGTHDLNIHLYQVQDYTYYIHYDNRLFFAAQDKTHGYELWETDGTLEGSKITKDIYPGNMYSGSVPSGFTAYKGEFYFNASDGKSSGLWKSNGSEAGTVLVHEGLASNLKVCNNKLFLSLNDEIHGKELWISDGTTEGTNMVVDINCNTYMSYSATNILGKVRDKILLLSGANDTSYWFSSDGTEQGTVSYKKQYSRIPAYGISSTTYKDHIYYQGLNDDLWITDGTTEGTTSNYLIDNPKNFFGFKDKVFFVAETRNGGNELYSTTEDISSADLFKHIYLGKSSSNACYFTEYKDHMYFTASDGDHGREVWKSNGTPEGTNILKDIFTGTSGSNFDNYIVFNDRLFFAGPVLYSSDGTTEGTTEYTDKDGNTIENPEYLTVFNSELYFSNDNGFQKIDKETNEVIVLGNKLIPITYSEKPSIVEGLGKLFFCSYSEWNKFQLWCSDGTPEGTKSLLDLNGPDCLHPANIIATSSKVYFTLYCEQTGRELWETDGTAANTKLTSDIYPGYECSNPNNFIFLKNDLLFLAEDKTKGKNLFILKGVGNPAITNENPDTTETSIKHKDLYKSIIYPNPAQNYISLSETERSIESIEFYTLDGTLLFVKKHITGASIDISFMDSGLYFTRLTFDDKTTKDQYLYKY